MICFTFTIDPAESECCKGFSLFALGEFGTVNVSYTVTIDIDGPDDIVITLQIEEIDSSVLGGACQWRLSSSELYEDATYPIDHSIGDCMNLPPLVLEGLSIAGCTGTISMSVYEPVKLPFRNKFERDEDGVLVYSSTVIPADPVDIAIPYSPCDCDFAADRLCVGGVRHADGGDAEHVVFVWNETAGDRWDYWPAGMTEVEANLAYLHEVIYLRGDSEGNCYLELDFEQTGPDTNDWADPPNSYDNGNPHNIRDGMVAIDFCNCGMFAQTTSTDGRSIRIHAGSCARYAYQCGTCRCIPPTLCVLGSTTDYGMFSGEAVWDGSGWVYDDPYFPFRLTLIKGDSGDCVMTVASDYVLDFEESSAVTCGNFLQSENSTAFNAGNPQKHAFIWASGSACGCGSKPSCGPCPTRCGGPPETLYLTIVEGIRDLDPYDLIDLGAFECTFSITLVFWDHSFLTPSCGYVGESYYTCKGVTYRVVAYMTSPGWLITVNKYNTTTGALFTSTIYPYPLNDPTYCEPFEFYAENNPSGSGAYYTFSVIE